jgi:hypothetical protein
VCPWDATHGTGWLIQAGTVQCCLQHNVLCDALLAGRGIVSCTRTRQRQTSSNSRAVCCLQDSWSIAGGTALQDMNTLHSLAADCCCCLCICRLWHQFLPGCILLLLC